MKDIVNLAALAVVEAQKGAPVAGASGPGFAPARG